ncbi:tRNA (adenosine(37)-N6)-threonylcarbamoyltransferase complex ATPase subunit type 1 TsaE [Corynebacterium alimapuense]|uniref:tRNA threonylcarbamoyladenosine biosynthesis protein TsaE n=1 Tax=Corynebacterium alimapuense TaxID=1576874 RepID=A0A3M8K7W4_9CORY|nr:tRNA (adenosine(37)-N6)-threonylcarbamoyltransferase complex ATPase subunit type 1 TsaE [Corynebacterium alimapuense]RNE48845.1 tRNA (adenosine(37)-N6)-threonylcarbamoyltransferase complex ATPase subunit type 1 TsaE [Corynebacterium alimapuense]
MNPIFPASGTRRFETAEETQSFGQELGRALEAGDVVILDGPLGAGKTTFTQGIARGVGVKGRVTSPTFVIAREHRPLIDGPVLIHVDAYRLIGEDGSGDPIGELDALDLDTALEDAVVIAEWGGGLVEQITQSYLLIQIDRETAVLEDPESQARIFTWNIIEA